MKNRPTYKTPIGQALWAAHSPAYPDRLLSTDQAAYILRLKKTYLETLRSRGGGPEFIRVNNRVYYDLARVIEWFETTMEVHS